MIFVSSSKNTSTTTGQRLFPPAPPPLSKRKYSSDTTALAIEQQKACTLLTALPPEIRNAIYEAIVWGEEAPKPPKRSNDVGGTQTQKGFTDEGRAVKNGQMIYQRCVSNDRIKLEEKKSWWRTIWTIAPSFLIPDSKPTAKNLAQGLKKARQSAHPLAFLLTCRQINYEATLIAFRAYTFTTSSQHFVLYMLQHSTSLLSSPQIAAITSIAYEFPVLESYSMKIPASFITNALFHFPGLQRIKVIVQCPPNKMKTWDLTSQATYPRGSGGINQDAQATGECRVPTWWCEALDEVLNGTLMRWPTGEKWTSYWMQDESVEMIRAYEDPDGTKSLTSWQTIAVRLEDQLIRSAPGQTAIAPSHPRVSLVYEGDNNRQYSENHEIFVKRAEVLVGMRAELVQEGGRRVMVDVEYGKYDRAGQKLWAPEYC